jgi:Ca2+-binding EF-hand superfamily protein
MFDEDDSGEIDFREFVLSCWNYCSLGRSTLMLFAFDLYDKDSSGIIDQKEIGQMLKDIYGKGWEKNTYAKKSVCILFVI